MSNPGVNPNIGQIPNLGWGDQPSLFITVQALKQAVDSLSGFRGGPLGRAVTFDDLIRLGLTSEVAAISARGASSPVVVPNFYTPPNPASASSAAMMGLGLYVVALPGLTGALTAIFCGHCRVDTNGATATIQAHLGSGSIPAHGASVTGALVGNPSQLTMAAANQKIPFAISVAVAELSRDRQLWLDLSLATSAGIALIENLNVVVLSI